MISISANGSSSTISCHELNQRVWKFPSFLGSGIDDIDPVDTPAFDVIETAVRVGVAVESVKRIRWQMC